MVSSDMANKMVLGIDIGGTKVAVGLVTLAGDVVAQGRVPTMAAEGPEQVLARLATLCRDVVADAGVSLSQVLAAGIGCAGPLDPERGLIQEPPNLPGWVDVPLVDFIQKELSVPAFLENDASAAALGEHRFGAGRGVANMVYLTISTGVGGGIIVGDRLYRGQNGNAGELGHMVVVHDGRPCNCGNRGCLEAYASGTGLAARARERAQVEPATRLLEIVDSPEEITAETVLKALELGDPLAEEIWQDTVSVLGSGLASVINIFNPRLVILGGGIINFGDRLFDPVRRIALGNAMRPMAQVTEIVAAQLGAQVGVVGAAAVAFDRLGLFESSVL